MMDYFLVDFLATSCVCTSAERHWSRSNNAARMEILAHQINTHGAHNDFDLLTLQLLSSNVTEQEE